MIKAKDIIKSYGNGESRFQVLNGICLDIYGKILDENVAAPFIRDTARR